MQHIRATERLDSPSRPRASVCYARGKNVESAKGRHTAVIRPLPINAMIFYIVCLPAFSNDWEPTPARDNHGGREEADGERIEL